VHQKTFERQSGDLSCLHQISPRRENSPFSSWKKDLVMDVKNILSEEVSQEVHLLSSKTCEAVTILSKIKK